MADVPEEAVEFARMAVRAFYPVEYAVVADGVLRRNNFCSHADLASQLRMGPKELRQILSRMVAARLMRSEKLQQKRINYKDERHPSRIVHTEFWHVPLPELIDAFQYRVDKIALDLDEKIRQESEQDLYQCQGCRRRYKLVDICMNADPETGGFFCDAVRLDRRPCNGEIREEDNSSRLKETESFKKRFEEDLKPLRQLADRCNGLKIPNHPLEGADAETWARYVPETIGARGEAVDAEGLNAELAAEVNGPDGGAPPAIVDFAAAAGANGGGDSAAIPDRPSWFKASSKDDDDGDDDWEENDEGVGAAVAAQPAFGTGAAFGAGNDADAKSYREGYMKSLGGEAAGPASGAVAPGGVAAGGVVGGEAATGAAPAADEGGDAPPEARLCHSAGDAAVEDGGKVATAAAAGQDAAFVFVKGVKHALGDITEELADEMTQEEFTQYCEVRERAGHDDEEDDDVEFE
jgi:transcription initiation factor IIE alpha subunit